MFIKDWDFFVDGIGFFWGELCFVWLKKNNVVCCFNLYILADV